MNILPVATKFGHVDIVSYILSLDQVDISSINNDAFENAVIFNDPKVVELLLKSGRLVNTQLRWNSRIQTAKYWGNDHVRSCFNTWFHEVCYKRFYHLVRIFLEYRDQIGLDISDGFAFRMAASLQPCEEDDYDGESESDDESIDSDRNSENESDSQSIRNDASSMDWTKSDDDSESARLTFKDHRIAITELLLKTGTAIPREISTDILNAASSLPFHLFSMVIDQGQYTTQAISELMLKDYECIFLAIRANQLEVVEYLWSFRDTCDYEVLYKALYTAILYNRRRFGGLIVNVIPKMDEDYKHEAVWNQMLEDMVRKNWDLNLVVGVWTKMNRGVKSDFLEYVVDNGVINVVNALTSVEENE
ncbi:hypothetical protein HDU76_008245 [Blyttiomyces sp. JEL0837]|nr:hypothetical protein HDU76_008245 [Blyttiomyces sp. JEL0837]